MNKLIVIDMQNAWLSDPATPRLDAAAVVERINAAAACVRKQGGEVIYIQHVDDHATEDSHGWQIIASLNVAGSDSRINKRACDSFAGTCLEEMLDIARLDTLYVCGLATEFCVDTTIRAAASRALNIVVLSDAHTTSDRPHMDAASIIAHHNWVWSNMAVPAGTTLAVKTTAQAFPSNVASGIL